MKHEVEGRFLAAHVARRVMEDADAARRLDDLHDNQRLGLLEVHAVLAVDEGGDFRDEVLPLQGVAGSHVTDDRKGGRFCRRQLRVQ